MFGVMGVINLAHGSLAVLSAYALFVLADRFAVEPFLGLCLVVPLMALIGWALQRLVLERSARGGLLVPVLSTFGLSIILDNLMFQGFGADTRSLAPYIGDLSYDSWPLTDDIAIGKLAALTMAVAVALLGGIQAFLNRTLAGRAIRATAEDPDTVGLVGVNARRVNAIAAAIAMATVAVAGAFLGMRATFDPYAGAAQLIFAFEASVIGGAGSLWGTLAGGDRARRRAESRRAAEPARLLHCRPPRVLERLVRAALLRRSRPAGPNRSHYGKAANERGQRLSSRALDAGVARRDRGRGAHPRDSRVRTGAVQRQRRRQAHDAVHLRHSGADVERAGRVLRARVDRPAGVFRARRLCRGSSRRRWRQRLSLAVRWARSSSARSLCRCRS